MIDCLIATCTHLPDLDPDDRLLCDALAELGMTVRAAVWSDPTVDWSADLCVVRSTWDYHHRYSAFAEWIDETAKVTALVNPARIIRWNGHKFYLRELEAAGVPIVPTIWLKRGTAVDLQDALSVVGWPRAVIKPAYGASADGVLAFGLDALELHRAQRYVTDLLRRQDALLQVYVETISTYHERALIFIGGQFSHAVSKAPFMHADANLASRAFDIPGTSGEVPVEAATGEIELGYRALKASPPGHVYARVDLVRDGKASRVLEVELIEPSLYLYAEPSAAAKLARAIRTVHDLRGSFSPR
jgi:glutathione synthase/RimK-type ligase-like ATP-grasp enzyme